MPTGYTAKIEEGCSFEEFLWTCVRGMTVCIMMRDDPPDAPIPDRFEPSNYYHEKVAKLRAEIDRLDVMTPVEVAEAIKAERETIIQMNKKYALEYDRKKGRYDQIRRQIEAWEPPSPDHAGLKSFMLDQIRISTRDEPYEQALPNCDPAQWLADKKSETQRMLSYYVTEEAKEIERTNARNQWLQQLRESVPQPAKATA